jgi:glycosyltransferase involved in cell wall biosynthesis
MPNFLIFAAINPRIMGKEIILDMHDNVPETFVAKFQSHPRIVARLLFDVFSFEERLSCGFAHRIVCANHVQRDVLVARGVDPGKIMVSLNVPDHRTFIPSVPGAVRGSNAGLLLVYHGTLARRLGIDLAIQAVGKLMSRIPVLEYHFFGMGDDKEEFLDVARDLGLGKQVFFEGFVPFKDLPRVLSNMDLGVISNRESTATDLMLPTKMLEYVALGIPVVAPRLKVIQYYFSDEMVKYFEPGNIESLADAIYELYRDPEKRKKQAGLAKEFINKYGWEKSQIDFINFYKGV